MPVGRFAVGTVFLMLQFMGTVPAAGAGPEPSSSEQKRGFAHISRAALLDGTRRVGLLPVQLPAEFEGRDDADQGIRDALTKYLHLVKMEVIGAESYRAAMDRHSHEVGGIYDATTGELKPDVFVRLQAMAQREFVEKERLDGMIAFRVIRRSAAYIANEVTWDGVRDRSDGKRNGGRSNSMGRVPVLSLTMQIFDSEGQLVFAQAGGIQPAGYYLESNYVDVQPKLLLLDAVRLDRAARVVTTPLRFTPTQISQFEKSPQVNAEHLDLRKLPELPQAYVQGYRSALLIPREQILTKVHRVVLGPLDPGEFNVSPQIRDLWQSIGRSELAPLGWEVVEPPDAHRGLSAKLVGNNLFDPFTGKRDEARAAALRKEFIGELASQARVDATLWLGVVRGSARYADSTVFWDGVSQDAVTLGAPVDRRDRMRHPDVSVAGGIEVVSLSAVLTNPEGVELYRARGGLQLLERMRISFGDTFATAGQSPSAELFPIPAEELFQDPARSADAIRVALHELTVTSGN